MLSIPPAAAPTGAGEPETRLKTWLEQKIGATHGVSSIALPDLKVGLLDNLVRQAEAVSKLDGQLQAALLKTHESVVAIHEGNAARIAKAELVDGKSAAAYLQQFGWNTAKYRPDRPIADLLAVLAQEATSADVDLKTRLAGFNAVRQQVLALDRKHTGDLSVRALDAVVRPADVVQNSEFLESVLVAVPLSGEKDFLARYEQAAPMVVPRSAQKITADAAFVLYSVTTFRKFAQQFVSKARELKWVPRDVPDACAADRAQSAEATRKQDSDLRAREERERAEIEKLASVTFSDIVKAWGHVKVIRVFIESVLRYGLPLQYLTASFEPAIAAEKAQDKLVEQFAYLGGNAVSKDSRGRLAQDSSELAEYAGLVEQDYKPFVVYVAHLP